MDLQQAIARLENKFDAIIRRLNYPLPEEDERGGVELACEILPNTSSTDYVYKLAKAGRVPCRKIGGRYEFSRMELAVWMAAGAPQPATKWAEEYRAARAIPEPATDAA